MYIQRSKLLILYYFSIIIDQFFHFKSGGFSFKFCNLCCWRLFTHIISAKIESCTKLKSVVTLKPNVVRLLLTFQYHLDICFFLKRIALISSKSSLFYHCWSRIPGIRKVPKAEKSSLLQKRCKNLQGIVYTWSELMISNGVHPNLAFSAPIFVCSWIIQPTTSKIQVGPITMDIFITTLILFWSRMDGIFEKAPHPIVQMILAKNPKVVIWKQLNIFNFSHSSEIYSFYFDYQERSNENMRVIK